jgi:hypothetical protein
MTQPVDAGYALALLRLLLDDASVDLDDLDWVMVRQVAAAEHVAVRLAERFTRRGDPIPPAFIEAAGRGFRRAQRLVHLAGQLGQACERLAVPHAFLKLAAHYPDAGADLDLLVEDTDVAIDASLLRGLRAEPRTRGFEERLAGRRTYVIDGEVVDIHHRRLGRMGEHTALAQVVLRRRRALRLDDVHCVVPTDEDQLLLLALPRSLSRPRFRLADVYWSIRTLRAGRLDWAYLVSATRGLAAVPALGAYLDYINDLHSLIVAQPEPGISVRRLRYPPPRVAGQLYLQQVGQKLATHDWPGAARLCLSPVAAIATRLARPKRRSGGSHG